MQDIEALSIGVILARRVDMLASHARGVSKNFRNRMRLASGTSNDPPRSSLGMAVLPGRTPSTPRARPERAGHGGEYRPDAPGRGASARHGHPKNHRMAVCAPETGFALSPPTCDRGARLHWEFSKEEVQKNVCVLRALCSVWNAT